MADKGRAVPRTIRHRKWDPVLLLVGKTMHGSERKGSLISRTPRSFIKYCLLHRVGAWERSFHVFGPAR
jgi:hypothetical protein